MMRLKLVLCYAVLWFFALLGTVMFFYGAGSLLSLFITTPMTQHVQDMMSRKDAFGTSPLTSTFIGQMIGFTVCGPFFVKMSYKSWRTRGREI